MPDSPHTADIVEELTDLALGAREGDVRGVAMTKAAAEIKALRECVAELKRQQVVILATIYGEAPKFGAALKDHRKVS